MTMIAYAFLQYRRLKTARREKKESTGRRRDRHCPPCARPSSNSSLDHRHSDAHAAENGFAAKSSVNKSAKVVLARCRPFSFEYGEYCAQNPFQCLHVDRIGGPHKQNTGTS